MIKLAAARMSEPLPLPLADGVHAWTDLTSPESVPAEQIRREQLRLGTTGDNYMCHAAIRDFFAGRRAVDSAMTHLATLATLQSTVDGKGSSRGGSTAASSQVVLPSVATLEQSLIDHKSELARLSGAYQLGYIAATGDTSALAALLGLAQCSVEHARRSAWYGLTVGGPLACDALLQIFPEMPAELAMNAAHALGQAAAPVTTTEDHARAIAICEVLMCRILMTRIELLDYSGGAAELVDTGATIRPDLPDFFATDRRRVLAESMASLALLTQHAIRFRSDPHSAAASVDPTKLSATNSTLLVAAAETLLPLLLEPEPGVAFPSYMAPECLLHLIIVFILKIFFQPCSHLIKRLIGRSRCCKWNAANALLRICSGGTEHANRPSVPTFR